MCKSYDGNPINRPVVGSDIVLIDDHSIVRPLVTRLSRGLTAELYDAMTHYLFVPLPTFVTQVILARQAIFTGRPQHLRFSALTSYLNRLQAPEMVMIHDGVTTFNMSDLNRLRVAETLERYMIGIVMGCCCGETMMRLEHIKEFMDSPEYAESNRQRTFADSFGEVTIVSDLDNIPDTALPQDEKRIYRDIVALSQEIADKNPQLPEYFISHLRPSPKQEEVGV